MTEVIVLNGGSSSGKSGIVRWPSLVQDHPTVNPVTNLHGQNT
ncbi:hypothetical protein ACFU6I_44900 [Streptomyces sp. NPDC057486]